MPPSHRQPSDQPGLFPEPARETPTGRARRSLPPETLNPAQIRRLEQWAERTVPWLSRGAFGSTETLDSYVEECLEFWGANGGLKANWRLTIQNRVRTRERERLARLAERGNREALAALRNPAGWRDQYDSAERALSRIRPSAEAETDLVSTELTTFRLGGEG